MKVYRVLLKGAGIAYVEADRYEQSETVRFFREDAVVSGYMPGAVQEITETTIKPGGGLLFTAETSDS